MSDKDLPQDKRYSAANIQRQLRRRIVTVTICPPGCENGICHGVFEDSLGLGYKIRCLCKKCHGNDGDKL